MQLHNAPTSKVTTVQPCSFLSNVKIQKTLSLLLIYRKVLISKVRVCPVKGSSRRERDASVVWRLNCINKRFRRNRLISLRRSQLEHYLHHVSHEIPSEEQLLHVRPASPTIFLRPTFCRE